MFGVCTPSKIIAKEEGFFAQSDGSAQFDHDAFVGWGAIDNGEGGVRFDDVFQIGLPDFIGPTGLSKVDLIVSGKRFPYFGTQRFERGDKLG